MDDFLQKLKKVVRTCQTDRLLANQIAGKSVRISCHLIIMLLLTEWEASDRIYCPQPFPYWPTDQLS